MTVGAPAGRGASLQSAGLTAVSPVYETEPVGGPSGQDRYLNLVVELDTELTRPPAAGRVPPPRGGRRPRAGRAVGPAHRSTSTSSGSDGEAVDEPDLQVPHPRMWQRRFVVAPLADLAPDLVPADWRTQRGPGRVRSGR